MDISIFGLGYVGAVSAACLSKSGHNVIGVDLSTTKVDVINEGLSPIIEDGLGELISEGRKKGSLEAVSDGEAAVLSTQISMICVGTPSQLNGSLDLSFVRKVCEEIGRAIANKDSYHVVVIRSTMLPGSMKTVVIPTLEEFSRKKVGVDFGVCINPEFLRESTAVRDYFNPPKTVIGEVDERCGNIIADLYKEFDAPLIRTDIYSAEMVKYADNVWHALKVSFANEIGNVCKELDIDSHTVMDIFCQDRKLNLSPYYLKPGFAFGGSCLPKDVRALNYKAKSIDLELPIIGSILRSNELQVQRALDLVIEQKNKNVSVLGFSFKAGTDDLRESPIVELIERLLGKGYNLKLYDRNVRLASLTGANKDYILNVIPHISNLMSTTMEEAISHGDTIIIGNSDSEFKTIFDDMSQEKSVVDLVRIHNDDVSKGKYHGLCW